MKKKKISDKFIHEFMCAYLLLFSMETLWGINDILVKCVLIVGGVLGLCACLIKAREANKLKSDFNN